jgi:hypothetical protein
MKKVLPITGSKFPQKTFAVVAIIAFVAFLLTLKPVAEAVKTGVEKLGITFPPMEVFRNVAQTIQDIAVGALILILGFAAAVVSVKLALIVVAAGAIAYGSYRLYNTFFKGETQNRLPESTDITRN